MTVQGREPGLTTADLAAGPSRPTAAPTAPDYEAHDNPRAMPGAPRMADLPEETHHESNARDSRMTDATPLFPSSEAEGFRSRWQSIQTSFVDEPRQAVEQADGMVAEMMQRLAQVFADERGTLEEQWSRGKDISTEDLRVALQRYRSFFDRLLAL